VCEFVTLKDHCKYSILLDVRGWGFSARLPLLLATGRPIIIASRNHELWFYHDGTFIPWIHYIPAGDKYGETISHEAVAEAVKWAIEHPEEAAKIGKAGQEYAQKYLTRDAIIKKIGGILLNDLSK
jgi:glycosyltransferase involved in cell wall biosynthesis